MFSSHDVVRIVPELGVDVGRHVGHLGHVLHPHGLIAHVAGTNGQHHLHLEIFIIELGIQLLYKVMPGLCNRLNIYILFPPFNILYKLN